MAQISLKQLAGLTNRIGMAHQAGLDMRMIWRHEHARARSLRMRSHFFAVMQAVENGSSLRDALDLCGDYFPILFREMVEVGETSGRIGETHLKLSQHYEHLLKVRRNFFLALIWPLAELCMAIFFIGILILVMGFISDMTGTEVDILGLGLVGGKGFFIYCLFIASMVGILYAIYESVRRGMQWVKPIQMFALKIPLIGKVFTTMALSRISWALSMATDTSMDIRRAVALSLRTSFILKYSDTAPIIDEQLQLGNSLYDSFLQPQGVFPPDLLDAIHIGEHSGNLSETLGKVSEKYQQDAEAALKTLAVAGFFLVMTVVVFIMVAMIVQVFKVGYLDPINDALPKESKIY